MTQVEITNFQSIKHVIFEFEGFTTIVGSNYIGKSALLRAINAALTNRAGVDFIRWGETFCEVKIKRPGLDLLWHKEEGHNFYVINKQRYDKIGRGEVPPILETLRYNPVKIGAEKLDLLYADQFNSLFMVDRRGSSSTDLLTSIYKLDQIYKAKELCDKDIKTNKGLMGFKEKDLAFSEKDIQKIAPFPGIKELFNTLISSKKYIEGLETDISVLKIFIQKLSVSTERCRKLKAVEKILLPADDSVIKTKNEINNILLFKTKLEIQTFKSERLMFIKSLPIVSVKPVESIYSVVTEVQVYLDRLSDGVNRIRKLSPVNAVLLKVTDQELESLPKTIKSIESYSNRFSELTDSIKLLSHIKEIKISTSTELDPEAITKLSKYQKDISARAIEITSLRTNLKQVDIELTKVIVSLEEYPNCPACGSQVEHTHE